MVPRLHLPKLHQRADSSRLHYRVKVPAALKAKAANLPVIIDLPAMGRDPAVTVTAVLPAQPEHVKFSLRTRDPDVAKARYGIAHAHVLRLFESLLAGPQALDFKTTVALAGLVYHQLVSLNEDEPGDVDNWAAIKGIGRAVTQGRISVAPALTPTARASREVELAAKLFGADLTAGIDRNPASPPTTEALESRYGLLVNWVLSLEARVIDAPSRHRLLLQVADKVTAASRQLKKNAVGDYSPDPVALALPALPRPDATSAAPRIAVTILFDRWVKESKPAASTVTTWRGHVKNLVAHAGHDDASRITPEIAIGWKDALVASGISGNTINRTHLSGMRAIYSFGMTNKLVSSNPFHGVKVAYRRRAGERKLPYDDDEVARLLGLASRETRPDRHWLPLICATTGCRVTEAAQLWGSSIRLIGDTWTMNITPAPDFGTLKNDVAERVIPIHPALVQAGFVDYVQRRGQGPLFYRRSSGVPGKRHASKGVSNHLAAWIRKSGFTDPRKAPMHAFRHWHKTACIKVDVPEGLADFIEGHGKRTEADTYRHYDMPTLQRYMAKIVLPT